MLQQLLRSQDTEQESRNGKESNGIAVPDAAKLAHQTGTGKQGPADVHRRIQGRCAISWDGMAVRASRAVVDRRPDSLARKIGGRD